MRAIKISQDRKACIGCHACIMSAPQTWFIDPKDGKSTLVGGKRKGALYVAGIFECDLEANLRAAKACPMRIIKIAG